MRVLFVDDESHVLEALRRQSRGAGFETCYAQSAELALAILAGEPIDVVVTDMRMPGMDGAALLERVRDQHPRILRIALSGDAPGQLRTRAEAVAQAWLEKPCSFSAIRQAILGLREQAG